VLVETGPIDCGMAPCIACLAPMVVSLLVPGLCVHGDSLQPTGPNCPDDALTIP
jgi:hypothetical protein